MSSLDRAGDVPYLRFGLAADARDQCRGAFDARDEVDRFARPDHGDIRVSAARGVLIRALLVFETRDQIVLTALPALDERIAKCATGELARPRKAAHHVEDACADSVVARARDQTCLRTRMVLWGDELRKWIVRRVRCRAPSAQHNVAG